MEQLGISTLSDYPTKLTNAETIWIQKNDDCGKLLNKIVSNILDTFTTINYNDSVPVNEDKVFGYAKQLLSIGCLYLELHKRRGWLKPSKVLQIFAANIH